MESNELREARKKFPRRELSSWNEPRIWCVDRNNEQDVNATRELPAEDFVTPRGLLFFDDCLDLNGLAAFVRACGSKKFDAVRYLDLEWFLCVFLCCDDIANL